MEFVRSEFISLNTRIQYLRFNPNSYSFIASLGLGFFNEILKDLNSLNSQKYLQIFYQELNGIPEILAKSKLGEFYEFFVNFCQNLKDFQNFVEVLQKANDQSLVYPIFYVFSALYCKILEVELFVSQPSDFELFRLQIEYFLNRLKLKVTFFKNNQALISLGSGLNIDILLLSSSDFSLILSIQTKVQTDESKLIEELFRQMSIPKSIEKFDKIIELIDEYSATFRKTTPEMENIKSIRKKWTCNHDLAALKAACGKSHCLQCLFDAIKSESPENSKCPCGRVLTYAEVEKVFKNAQPAFDRYFMCGRCDQKFKNSTSLHCPNHKTCLNCRKTDLQKCVECFRLYSPDEINEKLGLGMGQGLVSVSLQDLNMKNARFQLEVKEKQNFNEFQCFLCKRTRNRAEVLCQNSCEVCRMCFLNNYYCPKCRQYTNVRPVYTCVVCKAADFWVTNILPCLHPVHDICSGNHRC